MSVLQVLHIPDERLRKVAKPVEEVNAEIQRIVDDMFETMYAEEGIGLAATQVDIHQRIIVIDVSENRDERLCRAQRKLKFAPLTATVNHLNWKQTVC